MNHTTDESPSSVLYLCSKRCPRAFSRVLKAARIAQRAMDLSADQRKMLREEIGMVMAKSAALHRERAAVLQALDVRMTSDDGHSAERIAQARIRRVVSTSESRWSR